MWTRAPVEWHDRYCVDLLRKPDSLYLCVFLLAYVFAFVFSSASKNYCVHLSVYVFLSLFVRRALMCIYVIFCLCLCICLLTLPLSLLLSFWDKHKQSISLPCPCLCICLYYFAYRCLSFGDKHNCVNRPFLVFFAFFLCVCLFETSTIA